MGSEFGESGTNGDAFGAVPEGESEASVGRALMEQLLADPSHDYRTLKYGDVIDGTLMRVDRDELLIDIGSKSEGIIPAREFSSMTDDEKDALNPGDKVLVFVVQPENQDGHAVVSIDRARQEKSWRVLQQQYEDGQVISAEVVNYNKGGLLVNLDGVRGFVPASQVTEIRGGDDAQKQADMARLIGSKLQLKIIEINRHRNRLILSERQALQERRDVMKERLIEELREGEVRQGRVSSICDFGAFVDVGGADGLVHLSELSWSRVRHPGEVLQVGQEVDVFVLGINAEEKKIALSIKRTQAEPWSRVAANYDVNQLVVGTVTQLANFGAFARIEDGIEGLVHVSELSDARINHPRELVNEGQDLLLRIIRIDPQRRRMGLSLRRALEATDEEVQEALGPEAVELKHRLIEIEASAGFEMEPEVEEAEDEETEGEIVNVAELVDDEPGNAMAAAMAEAVAIAEANELVTGESDPVADEVAEVLDEAEAEAVVASEAEAIEEAAIVEAVVEAAIEEAVVEAEAEELVEEAVAEAVIEEAVAEAEAEELVEEAIAEAVIEEAVAEVEAEELVEEAIAEAVIEEAVAEAEAEELVEEAIAEATVEEVVAEVRAAEIDAEVAAVAAEAETEVAAAEETSDKA